MNERKGFLLLLIGILVLISGLMVRPFMVYILGAVILSFILHPLHTRLRDYTGHRVSSALVVVLAVVLAIIPVIMATAFVLEDARTLASDLSTVETVNITRIEMTIKQVTGQEVNIEENLRAGVESFVSITVGNFSQILGVVTNVAIGLSLMLFLMYYMVKDGEGFSNWIKSIVPMPSDLSETLLNRVNQTTWAVIKGHVLVAILQGLIAGLGLFLAGVPNYFFWTFMMVILSFIPIIGSSLVWVPAVIYLVIMGRTGAAFFLAIYCTVVVGLTDNFFRPLLVDEDADLHPAMILVGVIGGVYLLGAPGLFIGPIILGVLKSTLMVFKNNYEDL